MSFSSLTHLKSKYCSWHSLYLLKLHNSSHEEEKPEQSLRRVLTFLIAANLIYTFLLASIRSLIYFRKGALWNQQAKAAYQQSMAPQDIHIWRSLLENKHKWPTKDTVENCQCLTFSLQLKVELMVKISELVAHKQHPFSLPALTIQSLMITHSPVHKDSLQSQMVHISYTAPASWLIHREIHCGQTSKSMWIPEQ